MCPDAGRPPPRGYSRATRRTLAALTASALLELPSVAFPTGAQAATCTPSDAWTEIVPAVGEPTIIVANPDYVPEVLAVYETVTHPALTETRTQPAQRYSWNPKGQVPEGQTPLTDGSTPLTQPGEWQANTTNYNGTDRLGEPFFVGGGNDGTNGSWFFWTTTSVEVVITPAWDEGVLLAPAAPEQGEPTIEVANPDYVPASRTEHPAVVCASPTPAATVLAETGSDTWAAAAVATALVLLGSALTVVFRRRSADQH